MQDLGYELPKISLSRLLGELGLLSKMFQKTSWGHLVYNPHVGEPGVTQSGDGWSIRAQTTQDGV